MPTFAGTTLYQQFRVVQGLRTNRKRRPERGEQSTSRSPPGAPQPTTRVLSLCHLHVSAYACSSLQVVPSETDCSPCRPDACGPTRSLGLGTIQVSAWVLLKHESLCVMVSSEGAACALHILCKQGHGWPFRLKASLLKPTLLALPQSGALALVYIAMTTRVPLL